VCSKFRFWLCSTLNSSFFQRTTFERYSLFINTLSINPALICNLRRKEQGTKSIKKKQKKKIENRNKNGKMVTFCSWEYPGGPGTKCNYFPIFIPVFTSFFFFFFLFFFCLFMLRSSSLFVWLFLLVLIVWFRWLPFRIDLFQSPVVGCLLLRDVLKGIFSFVVLK